MDVLTPLSYCRHETVERIIERRISGVSYMCWMDFRNAILCCGFLCARLISVYLVSISASFLCLFCVYIYPGYHAEGYHAPSIPHGLSRLYHHCTAITPVYASRLSRHSSLFYSLVITPELSRPTTHVHRVITPAIVSSL